VVPFNPKAGARFEKDRTFPSVAPSTLLFGDIAEKKTVSALDDIQASIRELKFYRENIFIPLEAASTKIPDPEGPRKTAI